MIIMDRNFEHKHDPSLVHSVEDYGVYYLLQREGSNWDTNLKWEDITSLGKQQRLGMHAPYKVFNSFSEKFSATSVDLEEHLYGLAKDMGITVVSSSQILMYVDSRNFPMLREIKEEISVNLACKEVKDVFKAFLESANVGSNWTWDRNVGIIGSHLCIWRQNEKKSISLTEAKFVN
ncbi:ABC transporter D family member 1 [Glycine soja]